MPLSCDGWETQRVKRPGVDRPEEVVRVDVARRRQGHARAGALEPDDDRRRHLADAEVVAEEVAELLPPSPSSDAVDVRDRQRVTINIAVVAKDVDRDGAVFGDREAVVRLPPARR